MTTTGKPDVVTTQVPQEVMDFITSASKRSNYQWSQGSEYLALDHYNEGKIALSQKLLALLQQKGWE